MDKRELQRVLDRELDRWCAKPYQALVTDLADTVTYSGGDGAASYRVEVLMLERTPRAGRPSLTRLSYRGTFSGQVVPAVTPPSTYSTCPVM